MMTDVAILAYSATAALGWHAWRTGRSYGRWHHALYALSCVTTLIAISAHPSWVLLAPSLVLVCMPFTRKGSAAHRRLGVLGLIVWFFIGTMSRF